MKLYKLCWNLMVKVRPSLKYESNDCNLLQFVFIPDPSQKKRFDDSSFMFQTLAKIDVNWPF